MLGTFVYMTGHLDGTGINRNLHQRNEQIRNYCKNNKKIIYDFADIESYEPDDNYITNKGANDNCDCDSNGDGITDRNWAADWQNTHTLNTDWYNYTSAHSQPLNANLKAYAAWWLWSRLALWSGPFNTVPVTSITVTGSGGLTAITTNKGTLQLTANISPSNASNKTVTWSVVFGSGQASISPTGLVTAISNGTVTAVATPNDGSGAQGQIVITIYNQVVPVEAIIIETEDGSTTVPESKISIQLKADIIPEIATNKDVIWEMSIRAEK